MDTDGWPPRRAIVQGRSCRVLRRSRDTTSADQKLVGPFIVGMLRQSRGCQGVIELSVERESPVLDIFPRYLAPANGQEPITILVHSEWDETVPQNHDP